MHGPRQDGRSAETLLRLEWDDRGPKVLWQTAVGTGYSAPVVAANRVLVLARAGDEELVECRVADRGDLLWTFRSPTSYDCKVPYSDGPYSTPTIAGGHVYTLGAEGVLRSLDFESGALLWERDLAGDYAAPEGTFGCGVSPLVDEGRVILNLGAPQAGIIAVDAETGETLWTATDAGRGYATAVVAEIHGARRAYVLTAEGLVSLDPVTGAVDWKIPFGVQHTPERVNAVTPLVVGDLIVLTSGPGPGTVVLRILPGSGHELVWKDRRVMDSQYTNLVADAGRLFGATSLRSANLRAIDLETGKMIWEYPSDLCRANSLLVAGHLLVLGEHGHLACFDARPREPELRWMTAEPVLDPPCYSAPALAGGLLFVRNERKLLCLDLRAADR